MNSILNNLNTLNRSLEGIVEVGKEFEGISMLWNNYFDGMARVDIEEQKMELLRQQELNNENFNDNEEKDEMDTDTTTKVKREPEC